MSPDGAGNGRQGRIAAFWAKRRARWTLPLVIIVIIIAVATIDHIGARRISQVDKPTTTDLVGASGGSATVDLSQPWSGFNPGTPAGAGSSTPALLSSVLPSAFTFDPDLVPVLNAQLLTSVEVTSTSPLTIQYVINPSAVWSDGVPVTAEDFVYAWKSQRGTGVDADKTPDQVASTLGYRDVASVTGSQDGRTVTVVFGQPYTDWRIMFSEMVPAHIAEKVGWNHGFDTFDPMIELSAGPFVLRSASPDGTAVLVRNPRWWGPKATLNQVVVGVRPATADWAADLSHGNHTVAEPDGFDPAALSAVSGLPNAQSVVKPSLDFLQLEFNVTSATTDLLAVRQAVAHAVDRQSLLSDTFGSMDPELTVNEDHLAVPAQTAYQQSSASSEYDKADPAAVTRLLATVGFHRGATGLFVDAAGRPLTIRLAVDTGEPWVGQVAAQMVDQLEDAGITVVTVPVAGVDGLAAAAATNGYDAALVVRTANPYLSTTVGWYSNDLGPSGSGGAANWSNFDDPDVDQLFAEAAQELNPVAGASVYAQIDDALWGQMVALPLFGEPALVAHGAQLANVEFNPSTAGVLWNLPLWSVLVPKPANSD